MTSRRWRYLVIFAVLLAGATAAGLYWRQRAVRAEALRQRTAASAANCDTPPPPPPKPAAPPPKLPGFAVEAACGPGGDPAVPAKKKK